MERLDEYEIEISFNVIWCFTRAHMCEDIMTSSCRWYAVFLQAKVGDKQINKILY